MSETYYETPVKTAADHFAEFGTNQNTVLGASMRLVETRESIMGPREEPEQ
jgi:hypothetical protein